MKLFSRKITNLQLLPVQRRLLRNIKKISSPFEVFFQRENNEINWLNTIRAQSMITISKFIFVRLKVLHKCARNKSMNTHRLNTKIIHSLCPKQIFFDLLLEIFFDQFYETRLKTVFTSLKRWKPKIYFSYKYLWLAIA